MKFTNNYILGIIVRKPLSLPVGILENPHLFGTDYVVGGHTAETKCFFFFAWVLWKALSIYVFAVWLKADGT